MKASDKVLNNIYRAQQLSGEKERLQLRPKECNSISACLKQYQYWNISLKDDLDTTCRWDSRSPSPRFDEGRYRQRGEGNSPLNRAGQFGVIFCEMN